MKILPAEDPKNHEVSFVAETKTDKHVLNEFCRAIREHPVLRGRMMQEIGEEFPTLELGEIGS
jgi:hypothetical protein